MIGAIMRQVTERDFRMLEYKDADVADYEFRADGALVRKDRWERAIRHIAELFGNSREFEIDDVVDKVIQLIEVRDAPKPIRYHADGLLWNGFETTPDVDGVYRLREIAGGVVYSEFMSGSWYTIWGTPDCAAKASCVSADVNSKNFIGWLPLEVADDLKEFATPPRIAK